MNETFNLKIGPWNLRLEADTIGLRSLSFLTRAPRPTSRTQNPILLAASEQLAEYFTGKRKNFAVPLHIQGTDFQMSVWERLQQIPFGTLSTYSAIAASIGKPLAARAVGMAIHRNPLPILLPCHRVIGTTGALVGFAPGIRFKENLLRLEEVA